MGIICRLSTRGHPLAPNGRAAGRVRNSYGRPSKGVPNAAGTWWGAEDGVKPMVWVGGLLGSSGRASGTRANTRAQDLAGPGGSYGIARAWAGSRNHGGEFDPGSGSTLAACLMHASRTGRLSGRLRGGRVRNTWATCPGAGDSRRKRRVIPHARPLVVGRVGKGSRRALGGACGRLASWWGNGPPRR